MRRKLLTVAAVVLLIALTFLAGGAVRGGRFTFTLYDGETPVIRKEYRLDLAFKIRVAVLYNGDYYKFYESLTDKSGALSYLSDELQRDVMRAAAAAEYPPEPATVTWDKKKFTYYEGKNGVSVDRSALTRGIFYSFNRKFEVRLIKNAVPPSPSKEDLIKATGKLASYTTRFATSSPERKHNIALAASRIDGTVIPPGGIFSFNETVGERTVENGFRTAKIIKGGKFVDGVGGGVCQVSTTIYNAALLSGVRIMRAEAHSLPVSYAPLSFDAMVSSQSDLQFANDTTYNYYISAAVTGDAVTFTFYGVNSFGDAIPRLRSLTLKAIPTDEYEIIEDDTFIPEGSDEYIVKEPKSGYISEGYLDLYSDGKLLSSVRIRKDRYLPQKGIKAVRKKAAA